MKSRIKKLENSTKDIKKVITHTIFNTKVVDNNIVLWEAERSINGVIEKVGLKEYNEDFLKANTDNNIEIIVDMGRLDKYQLKDLVNTFRDQEDRM